VGADFSCHIVSVGAMQVLVDQNDAVLLVLFFSAVPGWPALPRRFPPLLLPAQRVINQTTNS